MHQRICFFFQAEDGIRDVAVTGVQTCALPISQSIGDCVLNGLPFKVHGGSPGVFRDDRRSEECRVGKECRSRWSPYHYKKKINEWEMSIARTQLDVAITTQKIYDRA